MTAVSAGGSQPLDVADLVAAAVLALPGVADLHPGSFGEVATYLPGRRVKGVRVRDTWAEVHVVLWWGAPVLETAAAVRDLVQGMLAVPVDVSVQDVLHPLDDVATRTT